MVNQSTKAVSNNPISLTHYYNRFSPSNNWEALLFRAGYVLQSAEMNEIQSVSAYRRKQLGDAIFKDGAIIKDGAAIVNEKTGDISLQSGLVYLFGEIRPVPAAVLKIKPGETAIVGIKLSRHIIDEIQDPSLADPAIETESQGSPGACRLVLSSSWVIASSVADDDSMYPVHYIDNGTLRAKEAPPVLDSTTQAIARYDVDNNGSNYIVAGMSVSILSKSDTEQVFSVEDGRARVNGYPVALTAGRRLTFKTSPDLRSIFSEPHQSTINDRQWVELDRVPVQDIETITITSQKTQTIVHSTIPGSMDPLPDSSITEIVQVKQGAKIYVSGTDYKLTGGQIDWSLPGSEPAPGSSYEVIYNYMLSVAPEGKTDNGFYTTGALKGTLILTSYTTKMPRIDRIAIDSKGQFHLVPGVSTDYNPVPPDVPNIMLAICQVKQFWDGRTSAFNDGLKMVPMSTLSAQQKYLMTLTDMVAQLTLISDTNTQDGIAMKGLFVDPFINDRQRDLGSSQTAAIAGQSLTLPVSGGAFFFSADIKEDTTCDFTEEMILEQPFMTGEMKINPYQAYAPFPAHVVLDPSVDNWVEYETVWASPETKRFVKTVYAPYGKNGYRHGDTMPVGSETYVEDVSETVTESQFLRSIDVNFTINGFGAGEELTKLVFDGISVAAEAV